MTLAVWASLGFLVVALTGSLAWAAARGWSAWRTFGGTSSRLGDALATVTAAGEAAEARALSLADGNARLPVALARLQAALADLAVLGGALGEARELVASIRGIVPRK